MGELNPSVMACKGDPEGQCPNALIYGTTLQYMRNDINVLKEKFERALIWVTLTSIGVTGTLIATIVDMLRK